MSRDSRVVDSVAVVLAADDAYAMPLAVTVRSLLEHARIPAALTLYILDGGLTAGNKRRLDLSWAPFPHTRHWIRVDERALPSVPLWGRMRLSTYYRVFIPELLPVDLERAIWLDADMIVLRDVADLWAADLAGVSVLAVQDMVVPFVGSRYGVSAYRELGLPAAAAHFNAGTMLVNLQRWRADDVSRRVVEYVQRFRRDVYFWDQEGLNAVLAGRWRALDPRWNQIAGVAGRAFYRPRHLDRVAYRAVVDDPWIVHFAGSLKPWLYRGRGRAHRLFYRYLDRTDWAGWRPRPSARAAAFSIYDSALRNLLYPVERWWLAFLQDRGRDSHGGRARVKI